MSTDFLVVIVTGGSSRIASALARGGYVVVIAHLEAGEADGVIGEIEHAGGVALAIRADLDDELDVERLFDETTAAFGGVDVVVHTAPGGETVVNRQAAHRLRPGGAILRVPATGRATAALVASLDVWLAARESARGSPGANGRPHEPPWR
jgi:3-oxoacyl-[acyl-carrier protein] reductase